MICPRCGEENLEGIDRCSNCMEPLRDRDVPQPTRGLQRLIMEEPVSAISSSAPVVVAPHATVAEAVRRMREGRIGCVLVVENDLLVGVFTERDVLMKFAGTDKNLDESKVTDVMTRSPEKVETTKTLRFALNKMSVGGFRHIPITDQGRLTGIVTAKDALKFIAREALYKGEAQESED
ncbi:MAG: CBS domain-containing protein [Blastocatellia bacterium]|nr:CBS domain-containing protein [Blastocatellia bacterium]